MGHFARSGYEGASLANIADDVKIKKQSIYNHYKGKDDLFLAVFNGVAAREIRYVDDYLQRNVALPLEELLYGFLNDYRIRYEQEDDTKFFLRVAFFPPTHLEKEILDYSLDHVDQMELLMRNVFESKTNAQQIHSDLSALRAAKAYFAVLDSLFVEMLYSGPERALTRLDAAWFVFWRGVRK